MPIIIKSESCQKGHTPTDSLLLMQIRLLLPDEKSLFKKKSKIQYFQTTFVQFLSYHLHPIQRKSVSEIVVIFLAEILQPASLPLISASLMDGNPIRSFLNAFDCLDTSRLRELILMKYTVSILE